MSAHTAPTWTIDLTRPREDYGFFGPGSPTWKVFSGATGLFAILRVFMADQFHPHVAASVADTGTMYVDPTGRLDRSASYALLVALADSRTAIEASETLMKAHTHYNGRDPVTGGRYNANSPQSGLWVHVVNWHSALKCHEVYGQGALTRDEEDQYWSECAVAAELQTVKPCDVPRSRPEVRQFLGDMRPHMCTSDRSLAALRFLTKPPLRPDNFRVWAAQRVGVTFALATMPRYLRNIGNVRQSVVTDALCRGIGPKALQLGAGPAPMFAALRLLGLKLTHQAMQLHYRSKPVLKPVTVTPEEAKKLYGQEIWRLLQNDQAPRARAGDVSPL